MVQYKILYQSFFERNTDVQPVKNMEISIDLQHKPD